jgi:hypothetical protein
MNEPTFMDLNTEEKAEVITDMVVSIAQETGYPILICIAMVAEYKGYSIAQIERYVKMIDSDLFYQVAFFDGEKKVYKYQVDKEVKHAIEKYLVKPILEHPFEVTSNWIKKTIQEFFFQTNWELRGN